MIELTPEKLREAADVVEAYSIRCKGAGRALTPSRVVWSDRADPDLVAWNPATLRRIADRLEAENAEKVERDKAIEELANDMGDDCNRACARRAYDAGWRKATDHWS